MRMPYFPQEVSGGPSNMLRYRLGPVGITAGFHQEQGGTLLIEIKLQITKAISSHYRAVI